jgi:hypothetical protein
MHQSPAAIFANRVARPVSGLTSTFQDAGESPSHARRRAQWLIDSPLLAYRCGGSAGIGLVNDRNTHRLPVSLAIAPGCTEKTAKHLTTSPGMLTAVREIGKLQTHPTRG